MKRHAAVLTSLALLAGASTGTASAAPADAPAQAAGVRKCSHTSFATFFRATRVNCRRARQVAQYWETKGRCPGGWRFSRPGVAPPSVGAGRSLLRCTKRGGTRQSVTWVENGE